MNNKNILLFINNFPNITQRKLAEKLEVSLGKVNLDIKKLELEGFIYKDSGYYLTEKGKIKLKELKKQEIKTAVILAAGVSKDFIYPNGFSKIENESLVERSIKNLIEVGIEKIYIVIGYEKKYYQELAKNYSNIVLIENLNYERYSSYFSLKLLEKYLNESFILLDSDILYEKKALKKLIKSSKEDVIIVSSESGSKDECFVEITNNNLTKMSKDKSELKKIDGEMLGISKLSSRYFYEICKLDVKNPFYSYEYAIADIAKKIPLSTLKLNELVWGEVDTEEQYKKVLKNIYPRLKRNEEFEKIEEIKNILISVLDIELVDIDEIEVLGGMTNKNYLVTINKKRYVLRIPGAGTKSIINRYSEKINAKEASRIGVDKHLIYFDSETGIKISEYIENAETLNPETSKKIESIELTSELLKKLHLSDVKFDNRFNVFEEILKYEALIKNKNLFSKYKNYLDTRENIFSLEKILKENGYEIVACHNDTVPENFIKNNFDEIYLIDWEYSGMNDPMWDLAAHFLESRFSNDDEEVFLENYFEKNIKKCDRLRIEIYKVLQDFLWSIWTILKEENGDDFGSYGLDRYNRGVEKMREIIK